MSFASLLSRIAFFSESDSAPHYLPFSSSKEPVGKKTALRCECTPVQAPRTSISPYREVSPVLFTQSDQGPSTIASDLVSLGGSDDELTRSWHAPYSARLHTSASSAFTSVNGAEDKGYEKLPPLDELVQHLCPSTAIGWKAKSAHLSKPCRTTSVFTGRTYFSARQVPSALHSMAVLQIFQTKLLASTDESGPDPVTLRELRNATDLALGHRTLHGQSSGARVTIMADLDGDQRH